MKKPLLTLVAAIALIATGCQSPEAPELLPANDPVDEAAIQDQSASGADHTTEPGEPVDPRTRAMVGRYSTELAGADGMQTYTLELMPGGSARLTIESVRAGTMPILLEGDWEEQPGSRVRVKVTGRDAAALELEIGFRYDTSAEQLVAEEYPENFFGSEGLTLRRDMGPVP